MRLWASGFNAWGHLQANARIPRDLDGFERIACTEAQTRSILRRVQGLELLEIEMLQELPEQHMAKSGNGRFVVIKNGVVREYQDEQAIKDSAGRTRRHIKQPMQVVANETSFTVLCSTGSVWTWGDARYASCLGREISEESPADEPALVDTLEGIPGAKVVKVASGGYMSAALTESLDLYVWGCRPPVGPEVWPGLSEDCTPVDVQGHNVTDVGIGFDHMMVLVESGQLFAVGSGSHGQLGTNANGHLDWVEVVLPLARGESITRVAAGYKSSFALTTASSAEA